MCDKMENLFNKVLEDKALLQTIHVLTTVNDEEFYSAKVIEDFAHYMRAYFKHVGPYLCRDNWNCRKRKRERPI
jgi:hypothetical protein